MRTITELIWHTSASPEGRNDTAKDIDIWHRARGWINGIGYHKVVLLDGTEQDGRPETSIGAHVRGHNRNTIGYCYIGGVSANDTKIAKDTRTPAQKKTMLRLTKEAIAKYDLKKVSGHHDYANKACPCFPAKREYAHLLPQGNRAKSELAVLSTGDRGWRVKALQGRLVELGYPLNVDGHYGPATRNAVLAFQADMEIETDGAAGPVTMSELEASPPVDKGARSVSTAGDLEARGSRIIKKTNVAETTAKWSLAGMAGAKGIAGFGLLDQASSLVGRGQQAQGLFGSIQDLSSFVSGHWFWLLLIVGGVVIWQLKGIRDARVEDHQTGKTV